MYDVELLPKAKQFYANAELSLARKIARCLEQLEVNPRRHNNIKPLHGQFSGQWRYRVGDYRVIYQIDDGRQRVHITAIVHRGQAYE